LELVEASSDHSRNKIQKGETMSFQAYLDTIKAKTGKTPDNFRKMAADKGLTKHGEIIKWLKEDFELGHGHANAVAAVLLKSESRKASTDQKLEKLFKGKKEVWRKPYDTLIEKVKKFGEDISVAPTESYISLLKDKKKFAIVQASSAERLDIGIKLKGVNAVGRLEPSGSWNSMVTHRVKISDTKEIDKEVLAWLEQAYEAS
jgi:predicted transport protein